MLKTILLICALYSNLHLCSYAEENSPWILVWQDEFNVDGLPDERKWSYERGFVRNNEAQFYTVKRKKNIRIEDGKLIIEAHKEDYQDPHNSAVKAKYTAGSIHTHGKASWCYGRIEVRAKVPRGRGTWPAIWMLGDNIKKVGWPLCGELDILEHVGFDHGVVHANVHTKAFNHMLKTNKGNKMKVDDPAKHFHIYALEWFPTHVDFYVNKKKLFTFKNDQQKNQDTWPFDKKHYLILNQAIGGSWGAIKGIDDSIFPQQFIVDYVRVYKHQQQAKQDQSKQ